MVRHVDLLERNPSGIARLRSRSGAGIETQPRLRHRPDALRSQDEEGGRDAGRVRRDVTAFLSRLRRGHDPAARLARPAAAGHGTRGLHRVRRGVVALRLQRLEALRDWKRGLVEVAESIGLLREGDARLLVLTGAGVSAESGLRTFRDSNGLWEEHRVEDVASPEGFDRDPTLVWRFYSLRRNQAKTVEPNPGHQALAEVE